MMAERLRRLNTLRRTIGTRLFAVLDSEGVVFFQALVYVHVIWNGYYTAFIAQAAPKSLEDTLGAGWSETWAAMCMGVSICLLGKVLSFHPNKRRYWVYTTGLLLQFAGDFFALGAFLGYVMASAQETGWGEPVSAPWVYLALAECAFFLCWRDLRRYVQAERRVRRGPR